jgi:hypothetical protein
MNLFPYEFNLGTTKKITFKTPEQLLKWCGKELENWRVLNGIQLPFHQNIYAEIQSPIERLKSAVTNYASLPEQAQLDQELRSWLGQLSQMIANSQYIYSDSPLGMHIREAAKKDQQVCAAAYYLAIQPLSSSQNFTRLTGVASSFLAMYYLGVSPDTATAAVKSVEESAMSLKEQISKVDLLEHQVRKRLSAVETDTESRLSRVFALVVSLTLPPPPNPV